MVGSQDSADFLEEASAAAAEDSREEASAVVAEDSPAAASSEELAADSHAAVDSEDSGAMAGSPVVDSAASLGVMAGSPVEGSADSRVDSEEAGASAEASAGFPVAPVAAEVEALRHDVCRVLLTAISQWPVVEYTQSHPPGLPNAPHVHSYGVLPLQNVAMQPEANDASLSAAADSAV